MKTLLIADSNEEFRKALRESVQSLYRIEECADGGEALRKLKTLRPDVMILDLLLPGVDGVTLLQKAEAFGIRTQALVVTSFVSNYLMDAMERLGVGYVMLKPCGVEAVAERLADLMQEGQGAEPAAQSLQTCVDRTLHRLGFPTHLRGYACLRELLMEEIRNPGQQVTKSLYPEVGRRCNGNAKQVERAIRCLILKAWLYRDEGVWNELFPAKPGIQPECPSNKAFFAAVSDCILAEHQKKNTYSWKIG